MPSFYPPERRNLLLPLLLAGLVLAAAAFLVFRFTPHDTAKVAVTRTAIWQAHTVFKNDTILVGQDKAQDDLYVLATLRVEDKLRLPLFLKDFTANLTTANGEILATSAVEKPDLDSLFTTFPALRQRASTPLLRDSEVAPGQVAEGMVVLHFPVTQDAWDKRRTATLTLDFYHQPPITVPLSSLPSGATTP